MTDLIEAVHALTKGTRTKVVRDDGSTTVVRHDALLVQLETAVTSAITGNGGGAGAPTAVLVNSAALQRASIIRSQITEWCQLAKVRVTRDSTRDLTAWMIAYTGRDLEADWYTRTLHGWARTIRELLDPPKRIPLVDPCVACGATKYVNESGEEIPSPLVVEYDHVALHSSLRAVCRVCEVSWDGPEAVAELVTELKELHPETTRIIVE